MGRWGGGAGWICSWVCGCGGGTSVRSILFYFWLHLICLFGFYLSVSFCFYIFFLISTYLFIVIILYLFIIAVIQLANGSHVALSIN